MREPPYPTDTQAQPHAGAMDIFRVFLGLGLSSFGGPMAHIGYFHRAFVIRRQWLGEARFAHLLSLCQLLPGPASSQLGFTIGLQRGGWRGGVAAFAGFTLPSALLMLAFALWMPTGAWGLSVLHGLKLVAVVVVGQAIASMWRRLIPDLERRVVAVLVAGLLLWWPQAWMQWLAILGAACLGLLFRRDAMSASALGEQGDKRWGMPAVALYAVLLALSFVLVAHGPAWQRVIAALYQSGALVFGGGHVVLPLLKQSVVAPGLVDESSFLAGYGAAQAMPGPMFSLAAFLGQRAAGWPGALFGLLAMFLPGLLLVLGLLPWWHRVMAYRHWRYAATGVHAAVLGLLMAAFCNPVWSGSVRQPWDMAVVALAWLGLWRWPLPAWLLVAWCVLASCALNALHTGF